MSPRRASLSLFFVLVMATVASGCFRIENAQGPWQCREDGSCPGAMVCDDGVCCHAREAPRCRTLVLEDGTCFDGSAPAYWYLDSDGDGLGDHRTGRQACAQPFAVPEGSSRSARWVEEPGDCDDENPGVFPGAQELCDGLDNDCDGEIDEGLPRKAFWRDGDGDGAGDGQGMSLQACAAGLGFVDNGADCNDADPQVMPGAPERCNGQDDNCNGLQDEDVQGTGGDCLEPSRVGVCQSGRTACVNAEIVCRQHVLPSEETCNGLDDDCDGVVDQAPGCGGPPSLLAESGVSFGARNLGDTGLADVSTCLKSTTAGTADLFSSGTWLITGPTRHVAWLEKSSGTWDLSKPGLGLRLAMTRSCYTGCINPLWAPPVPQPVVLLCGPDGAFARYEPESSRLLVGGVGSDDLVPLAGGGGWRLVTPAADLSRIRRIEVVFQPNTDGQSNPNLRVVFGKLGFEPVP